MRLTTGISSGKAALYDRNPLNAGTSYVATAIAPHGSTTRQTYTVPALRKAQITKSSIAVVRDGTATTAGLCLAQIGSTGLVNQAGMDISTVIGSKADSHIGTAEILLAGQGVSIFTQDGSTAGTHAFNVALGILEFDA